MNIRFSSLSGSLPNTFGNLSTLQFVDITNNMLSGTINSEIGSLLALRTFDISGNHISGTIPNSLFGASQLTALLLEENSLSGTFPVDICILQELKNLNFQSNLISSTIPSCLGDIEFLNTLTVNSNMLTGTLPSSLAQLVRLNTLIINNNDLSGTVSANYVNFSALNSFVLHDNGFTGSLTEPPRLPETLVTIDISSNRFTGTLPTYLFHVASPIQVFSASDNCFSGSLTTTVCLISNLSTLVLNGLSSSLHCSREMIDLTHRVYYANFVPGSIPACYFDMPSLKSLYLSGNGLTGTMADMSNAVSLQNLYLSYNQLRGVIPQSLLQSTGNLRNLDLSTNRLSGTIEDMSVDFVRNTPTDGLSLYLQNNRLSGNIPESLINASSSNDNNHNLTVNILAGNMFSCEVFVKNVLPADPNNDNYVCGSNVLNEMMYLSGILLGLVCATCGVMLYTITSNKYSGTAEAKLWHELVVWVTQYIVWKPTSRAANKHLQRLADVFVSFRLYTTIIALVALILFLPLYTIIKYVNDGDFGQYTYQYGWVISVGFMQGTVPAVIIAILLLLCICVFTAFFRGVDENEDDDKNSKNVDMNTDDNSYEIGDADGDTLSDTVIEGGNNTNTKPHKPTKHRTDSTDLSALYVDMRKGSESDRHRRKYRLFLLAVCNIIIVCIVNGGYVYVLLYEHVFIQLMCTVLVIGFKLLWNPASKLLFI